MHSVCLINSWLPPTCSHLSWSKSLSGIWKSYNKPLLGRIILLMRLSLILGTKVMQAMPGINETMLQQTSIGSLCFA